VRLGQVVSQCPRGSLQTFTPTPEGFSRQNEEAACYEFQEKEDTPTSSPAAGGNCQQLGGVTSQGHGNVHFLTLPCPFAAAGRCEKYIFWSITLLFPRCKPSGLLGAFNKPRSYSYRESTHLRAYLVLDAFFP